MPRGFDTCVRTGGRVITHNISGRVGHKGAKYMHICYRGDRSYPGEVRTAHGPSNNRTVIKRRKH